MKIEDILNTVIEGDCLEIMKDIDPAKISMILTDPPYGMNLNTDWSGAKSSLANASEKGVFGGKKYDRVINDDKDFDPTPIMDYFSNVKEQFWFGADYYCKRVKDLEQGSWFIWDKRLTESADRMYGSGFEMIWSKTKHKRDLIRVKWAGVFGTETQDIKQRIHPNQKPLELIQKLLIDFSEEGDTILDLFAGGGSVLLACKLLNRNYIGIEISPEYVKIARDRLAQKSLF
jgi:site-specific DNA-methyltransferase (adenine-specific)